jgi:imidazolonepropionase-like amidohydrolase
LVAGQVPWMRAITDTTDIHQAVVEARGTGATAIKLYAELSGALARRITTEAHAQGLKVWAHAALRPALPFDVVEAGVDAVSHANLVALAMDSARRATALHAPANQPLDLEDPGLDTLFSAMLRRHTILEPTLLVFADRPPVLRLAGAIARQAHRRGVTIIAGTDTLGSADVHSVALPNLHRELELLVTLAGLSPAEALKSATRDAAAVLGAESIRGTIEVGKLADLLVLRSDPLLDIRNTRSIQLVMKRGRVARLNR